MGIKAITDWHRQVLKTASWHREVPEAQLRLVNIMLGRPISYSEASTQKSNDKILSIKNLTIDGKEFPLQTLI
jgi:hypothetical protein